MKRISVIIPVYNRENYLSQCIESVLSQTLTEFELILVNDGSTDRSEEICEYYQKKDSRVIVINKENSGVGETRNFGLRKATAEYVMFLDADDWMQPNMLERMYEEIEKNKTDLVICGYRYIYDEKRDSSLNYDVFYENNKFIGQEQVKSYFVKYYPDGMLGYPWNKLYRLDLIKQNHIYFPKMRRMEDGIFNLNFFEYANSCCVISDSLYNYRAGQVVMKKKLPTDILELLEEFVVQYYKKIKKWGYDVVSVEEPMVDCFLNEFVSCIENQYINENSSWYILKKNLLAYYDKEVVCYMMNKTYKGSRYPKLILKLYKSKRFKLLYVVIHLKYFLKSNMKILFQKIKYYAN